jgi:hypothetical protein
MLLSNGGGGAEKQTHKASLQTKQKYWTLMGISIYKNYFNFRFTNFTYGIF